MRLEIRRLAAIKQGDEAVGNRALVKVVKNKLAPPFRKVEFDIRYGSGICRAAELLDLGEELGLVEKSGSWLSFGEVRLGQGRETAREALLGDAELFSRLLSQVLGASAPGNAARAG